MKLNGRHDDEENARDRLEKYKRMRDEEVLDFIRDTVSELNALGDRLEVYAEKKESEQLNVSHFKRGMG